MVQQEYIQSSSFGTIDYTTGEIILTSANITSISNVDGAASTQVRVTVTPDSNDIVPVRNQVLSIDTANSSFTGSVDEIESGSSQAGTGLHNYQQLLGLGNGQEKNK